MRRLSKSEKADRGTLRKSRAPKATAVDRLTAPPRAPAHLSERARAEWGPLARATVELGVLTPADLRALGLLAECLATECELRETLRTEGTTIAGADGNRKAHPALRLLESTRNQAVRLLAEFGLTPRGRQGVDVRPPATENRFAKHAQGYRDSRPWNFDE
jgi:P27 family predicted phage terminase small subunit